MCLKRVYKYNICLSPHSLSLNYYSQIYKFVRNQQIFSSASSLKKIQSGALLEIKYKVRIQVLTVRLVIQCVDPTDKYKHKNHKWQQNEKKKTAPVSLYPPQISTHTAMEMKSDLQSI